MPTYILTEMIEMSDVIFPRSIKPSGTTGTPELLGWWDGGQPAFAGLIYIKWKTDEDKGTHVATLLASKARV